jgi:hypothetical protein
MVYIFIKLYLCHIEHILFGTKTCKPTQELGGWLLVSYSCRIMAQELRKSSDVYSYNANSTTKPFNDSRIVGCDAVQQGKTYSDSAEEPADLVVNSAGSNETSEHMPDCTVVIFIAAHFRASGVTNICPKTNK